MILRGYNIDHAFNVRPYESFINETSLPTDGFRLLTDNEQSRTLVERSDTRENIKYGLSHAPAANVKLYNGSRNPDASIAISFPASKEHYDDVFKIVKRPNGGYELHLQKIHTVIIDGKRIDVSSLSKYL